jgi:DNA-binding transcriptional LysR family regulator
MAITGEPVPHLFSFLNVAECESFTAAGRRLGISQAAVSQRIQTLEASLGCKLFRRVGGHATLTNSGRRLLEYARRIADLHGEVRMALSSERSEHDGDLSLAASSIPGNYVLPPSITAFQRAFPRVRVHLRVSDSSDVQESVESGRAELGFCGSPVSSLNLVAKAFAEDELALIVHAGHRLARRQRVGIREITDEPFVRRETGSGSRQCFERALQSVGKDASALNVVLEVEGNEGVKEAVLQGRGVAVMSRYSVEKERLAGNLKVLRINGVSLTRNLFMLRDRSRTLTEAAVGLIKCLRSK